MTTRVLGLRIQQRREELGISQEDLAEAIGTTRRSISNYERGQHINMETDTLIALATKLKKPISYFFEDAFGDDSMEGEVLDEFRSLPSDNSRQFAVKLIRELRDYSVLVEKGQKE